MLLPVDATSKRGDHIVDGEPRRVGVGEHARDERAQPALVLARRVGLRPAWR